MSSERDSGDTSLLRNLKFRRVREILAHQIPEGEARLLSNGRLTCVVCVHRPIFDNVNMLSIHRKGRRHIAELSKYLLHKRELQWRNQNSTCVKEIHANSKDPGIMLNHNRNMQSDEDSIVSHPNQKAHALLSDIPLSSCSKKRYLKIPLTMKRKMALETTKMSPRSSALVMDDSELNQLPSAHSEVRQYLKGLQRKKPLNKVVQELREGYGLSHKEESPSDKNKYAIKKVSGVKKADSSSHSVIAEDDSRTLLHPLTLMMPGWIWKKEVDGGKWVKDPDAEFDSDEEAS